MNSGRLPFAAWHTRPEYGLLPYSQARAQSQAFVLLLPAYTKYIRLAVLWNFCSDRSCCHSSEFTVAVCRASTPENEVPHSAQESVTIGKMIAGKHKREDRKKPPLSACCRQ